MEYPREWRRNDLWIGLYDIMNVKISNRNGSFTCVMPYYDRTGKRRFKRITGRSKSEVKREAIRFKAEHIDDLSRKKNGCINITVREALDDYILRCERKEKSPATVAAYVSMARSSYNKISEKNVQELTSDDIQKCIDDWKTHMDYPDVQRNRSGKSPKTIRNLYSFLMTAIHLYRPDFQPLVDLPSQRKPNLRVPTDDDIIKILKTVKNTRLEVPILLAATGGLRRSEICALKKEDVGDGVVSVKKANVINKRGEFFIKDTTKTPAGFRHVYVPRIVTDLIKQSTNTGECVVEMSPSALSSAFSRLIMSLSIPHIRLHDLRSYYATVLHTIGIPDVYIQKYGGWSDRPTLQRHYERAQDDKIPEMAKKGIDCFNDMLDTIL